MNIFSCKIHLAPTFGQGSKGRSNYLNCSILIRVNNSGIGGDCTSTFLPFTDFRAVFFILNFITGFFIVDFKAIFDCDGTRTILPFTDFLWVFDNLNLKLNFHCLLLFLKSKILFGGTRTVLPFTDFMVSFDHLVLTVGVPVKVFDSQIF